MSVRVVDRYKHLGSDLFTSPCVAPLVRARAAAAAPQIKSLCKGPLRSGGVSVSNKSVLINAYVCSRVLFDSGTWGVLTPSEVSVVHSTVMGVYRRAFVGGDFQISDLDVLLNFSLMPPLSHVKFSRISLFCRLVGKGHHAVLSLLWAVRECSRSWVKALQEDLSDLCKYGDDFKGSVGWGLKGWTRCVVELGPVRFKVRVRRALVDPLAVIIFLPRHLLPKPSLGDIGGASQVFSCESCSQVFPSRQQLELHRFSSHGKFVEAQYYVGEVNWCFCCMTCFHTRSRVVEHLSYKGKKRRCLEYLRARNDRYDEGFVRSCIDAEAVRVRGAARAGRRRAHAALPCYRICGPLIQPPTHPHSAFGRT